MTISIIVLQKHRESIRKKKEKKMYLTEINLFLKSNQDEMNLIKCILIK